MGRFAAPPDHHDDQDAVAFTEPMDWTLIPDDDDESNYDHNNKNDNKRRDDDIMMIARMQLNDNYNDDNVADGSNRQEVVASSYYDRTSAAGMMDLHGNNSSNNNNSLLLQLTQQCLQQLLSNHHFHQIQSFHNDYQRREAIRRRNKKILWTFVTIIVAVISVVLKWHAPPPPPVVMKQNPIMLSSEVSSLCNNNDNNILDSITTITTINHETWREYMNHMFQLSSDAILYTASVFWYSVYHSFIYAAVDVKDWLLGQIQVVITTTTTSTISDYDRDEGSTLLLSKKKKTHHHHHHLVRVNIETTHTCPIRVQAACNHHTLLPRGAEKLPIEVYSTEESLRQMLLFGSSSSLPKSQTLALQIIAGGIDSWGQDLIENASVDTVQLMATSVMKRTASSPSSSLNSNVQNHHHHHHDDAASIINCENNGNDISSSSTSSCSANNNENNAATLLEWIFPPAKGFLFVGPAGVGKLHVAQRVADWFFAHCNNRDISSSSSRSSIQSSWPDDDDDDDDNEMRKTNHPVLQILATGGIHDDSTTAKTRRSIIQHLQRRKGLGSVIIIHHIENLDDSLLSDIVHVLNGDANTIPNCADDDGKIDYDKIDDELSSDGTVFLLTSEQWGTKRIFQMIQRNNGLTSEGLLPMNEGLLSGIRLEVDSHLMMKRKYHWQRRKLNSHMMIVPFLPFQEDDMLLIMQSRFQELSMKYKDIHWVQFDVSTSALSFSVGVDRVDYLDLYDDGNFQPTEVRDADDESHQQSSSSSSKPLITFSTNGAHALRDNFIYTTLKSKLIGGTRRRPYKAAFLDLDEDTLEYVLSWCDPDHADVKECEEEWRLRL